MRSKTNRVNNPQPGKLYLLDSKYGRLDPAWSEVLIAFNHVEDSFYTDACIPNGSIVMLLEKRESKRGHQKDFKMKVIWQDQVGWVLGYLRRVPKET